jgi:hypothetical protein
MIGIIIVVVVIGVGIWIGLQANTSVPDPQPVPNNSEDCDQACQFFQTRQSERCAADSIATDAESYANNLTGLLQAVALASLGAAATIIAAFFGGADKIIAALGPVVAGIIIGGLLIVGTVLVLVLVALAAAALTAHVVAGQKRQLAIDAAGREAEARSILLSLCNLQEVESCLNLPSPC